MKTILKIITILLVAGIVAGVFSLAVNKGSSASSSNVSGQLPAMTNNGQSTIQLMARPEGGDDESGSITQGLAGIAGTLMKLIGISILVLLIQKGLGQLSHRKLSTAQR